jgi:hypothetical protein
MCWTCDVRPSLSFLDILPQKQVRRGPNSDLNLQKTVCRHLLVEGLDLLSMVRCSPFAPKSHSSPQKVSTLHAIYQQARVSVAGAAAEAEDARERMENRCMPFLMKNTLFV